MLSTKKLFTELLENLLYRTQRGFKTAPSAIASGGYLDVPITFAKAYESTPTVVATLSADSSSTTSENAKVEAYVISASTSGATIRLYNAATIARTPSFTWIAVGKVPSIGGGYSVIRFMSTYFSRLAERWWEYVEHKETINENTLKVNGQREPDARIRGRVQKKERVCIRRCIYKWSGNVRHILYSIRHFAIRIQAIRYEVRRMEFIRDDRRYCICFFGRKDWSKNILRFCRSVLVQFCISNNRLASISGRGWAVC